MPVRIQHPLRSAYIYAQMFHILNRPIQHRPGDLVAKSGQGNTVDQELE